MRLGVRRVVVLVWPVGTGDFVYEPLSNRVVRLWVLGRHGDRAHHYFGAVGPQQVNLFRRHLVGHDKDTLVATLAGHDGQADTGVS